MPRRWNGGRQRPGLVALCLWSHSSKSQDMKPVRRKHLFGSEWILGRAIANLEMLSKTWGDEGQQRDSNESKMVKILAAASRDEWAEDFLIPERTRFGEHSKRKQPRSSGLHRVVLLEHPCHQNPLEGF